MASETITPNMQLIVPSVGNTSSPDWATDTNADWSIIDSHNHTAGQGVPIPPGGLNINADLPFNINNATLLRSARFAAQVAPISGAADLNCSYVAGVDFYFNDGNGNQIQITKNGGIAGTSGSIANLTSPASASYVSGNQTFVWQSNVNTAANMDFASATFRNATANSHGLTLSPPNAMSADYDLVLPALPSVTNIMTLDSSGNMGASLNVDNATLAISGNTLEVKNHGITQIQMGALGQQVSASCGTYTTTSITPSQITNMSVNITTTGRPVFVGIIYSASSVPPPGVDGFVSITSGEAAVTIFRGSSIISSYGIANGSFVPGSCISFVDVVAAGTYTYTAQGLSVSGGTLTLQSLALIAYEL